MAAGWKARLAWRPTDLTQPEARWPLAGCGGSGFLPELSRHALHHAARGALPCSANASQGRIWPASLPLLREAGKVAERRMGCGEQESVDGSFAVRQVAPNKVGKVTPKLSRIPSPAKRERTGAKRQVRVENAERRALLAAARFVGCPSPSPGAASPRRPLPLRGRGGRRTSQPGSSNIVWIPA